MGGKARLIDMPLWAAYMCQDPDGVWYFASRRPEEPTVMKESWRCTVPTFVVIHWGEPPEDGRAKIVTLRGATGKEREEEG